MTSGSPIRSSKGIRLIPVFFGVHIGEVDRAVAVDDVDIGLGRQMGQEVHDVADGTTVDQDQTSKIIVALIDSSTPFGPKDGHSRAKHFSNKANHTSEFMHFEKSAIRALRDT